MIQQGQREAFEQSKVQGYQDQQARKDGTLMNKPIRFWNASSDAGYNAGADLAYGMNKEAQLRTTLNRLNQQYQYDPEGFNKALPDVQKQFFTGVNAKVQPQLQEMWNSGVTSVQNDISNRLFERQKAQNIVDVNTNLQTNVNGLVDRILQKGLTTDSQVQITQAQAQIASAAKIGIYSPEEANALQKDLLKRTAESNYLFQVNQGADPSKITQEILDPNGPMKQFGLDQRQQIAAEVHSQINLNREASASDRAAYETTLDAYLKLARNGESIPVDIATIQATMRKFGYTDQQIQANTTQLGQAQANGALVKVLKTGSLSQGQAMVNRAQQAYQNYTGSDPVEKANLLRTSQILAQAQAAKIQAFQTDPWAATQAYAPSTYQRYDLSTDQGLNAARADIVSKTGNANALVLPQAMLDRYKNTLDGAPDAATQANVLADVYNRYPRNFARIADAFKLTPGQRMAAEMVNQKQADAAATVLLAEHNAKNLETYAKEEDVNTAFDAAFPDKTVFTSPQQAGQMRANFANVYRMYLGQGLNDNAATRKTLSVLTSGMKQVRLNGENLLVPQDVDAKAVNKTLDRIAASPLGNNITLGPDNTYTNAQMGAALADPNSTRIIPQDGGFALIDRNSGQAYYQQTPQGKQLLIVERDGTIRGNSVNYRANTANHAQPGPWDGSVQVAPLEQDRSDSARSKTFGNPVDVSPEQTTKTIAVTGGKGAGFKTVPATENPLITAKRARQVADRQGLVPDPVASRLTTDQGDQAVLNGVSAVIRGGQVPDWSLQALAKSGVKEFAPLQAPAARQAVAQAFADPTQRGQTVAGVQETPLQTLERLTRTVGVDAVKSAVGYPSKNYTSFSEALVGTQPVPQFQKYADAIAKRERGDNYSAQNAGGYLGRYQMGAQALADAGLINQEALKGNRTQKQIFDDPNSWTIPGGKAGFLRDKALQDRVFRDFTYRNYLNLKSKGLITSGTPAKDVAGLLAASHLLGVGGAIDLHNGIDGEDGNGTTARSYYAIGRSIDFGDAN